MNYLELLAWLIPAAILAGFAWGAVTDMREADWIHYWPAKGRCPVCDERIFAWQSYGRQELKFEIEDNDDLTATITAAEMLHERCHQTVKNKIFIMHDV